MSADNYYRICRHPNGGYAAVMGFMSDLLDGHGVGPRPDDLQFIAVGDAILRAASETVLEYGIYVDPDVATSRSGWQVYDVAAMIGEKRADADTVRSAVKNLP